MTDLRKFEVGELIEGQYDERRAPQPTSWTTWVPRDVRGGGGDGGARSEEKNKNGTVPRLRLGFAIMLS